VAPFFSALEIAEIVDDGPSKDPPW